MSSAVEAGLHRVVLRSANNRFVVGELQGVNTIKRSRYE
jgi:hypothetical protein